MRVVKVEKKSLLVHRQEPNLGGWETQEGPGNWPQQDLQRTQARTGEGSFTNSKRILPEKEWYTIPIRMRVYAIY